MKIVQAHVRHRAPGGAEVMFDALVTLLRGRGHEVVTVEPDNATIAGASGRIHAALGGIYSPQGRRAMAALLRRERPDAVHFHNIYPLLSPSAVLACHDEGVPAVVSLHDYKLICPTGQNFRNGAPCRKCAGGREHHCLLSNCRGSMPESLAYATRMVVARRAGWLTSGVDQFVACSAFVRQRHVEEGFPADRITVIPNFARYPARLPERSRGEYAAFVGRLSAEKGVAVLVEAARRSGVPLRLAGAGPARDAVGDASREVRFVGEVSREGLGAFLGGARFVVVPSLFEEPFGLAAAEAMGHGLPVIASRTGGLAGLVEDGVDGFLVPPGDAVALADRMALLWNDPARAAAMGAAARAKAIRDFNPDGYCDRLERLYAALARRLPVSAA